MYEVNTSLWQQTVNARVPTLNLKLLAYDFKGPPRIHKTAKLCKHLLYVCEVISRNNHEWVISLLASVFRRDQRLRPKHNLKGQLQS